MLKAFGAFWYDFVVGDDWKIAAGVVVALGLTWSLHLVLRLDDTATTVVGAVLAVTGFVVSLVLDVRRSER